MSSPPRLRTIKRSLLAAVGVLAIASAATQPGRTRTAKHTSELTRPGPRTAIAQPKRNPPSAARGQPRAFAAAVARAYARYLANQLSARQLPGLTPQAMMMVRRSGPLPARLHVTEVRRTSLTGGGNSWTAHLAMIDAHGRQTTTTQLVLTAASGRWMVLELVPPDPDTLIATTPPALRPTGPPPARRAALGFTQSFLAYTYGHATARQLRDLTPTLRAAIASNPPQVPAAIRALRPRIASLALAPQHGAWLAEANVTDGQDTYQVISLLHRLDRDWLAFALRSAG
ncbi:MAG: hypothetical protein WAL38_18125 [Solirubrobacteraceae bacterium]